MLQQIGIVALGGALGATLRYVVSEWVSVDSFPYATLSINLVGSFLLGVMAVGLAQNLLSANMALLLGTGVLGAFTTMSTFSVETVQMFTDLTVMIMIKVTIQLLTQDVTPAIKVSYGDFKNT